MKTAVFSTKPYDAKFLVAPNASAGHELDFFKEKLRPVYSQAGGRTYRQSAPW
jgi:hypothetical protein